MDKKTIRFFRGSIISIVLISIMVFIGLTVFMSKETEASIEEISYTYMSEMSVQIQQKFQSIVDLRFTQVKGMIERTPPASAEYGEALMDELVVSAQLRNFPYLAFYGEEDNIEMICGDALEVSNHEHIKNAIMQDGNIVAAAEKENGEKYILLGVQAEYPMADGEKSIAILAGFPSDYLNDALFLSGEESLLYYHIINMEGNFVIRNAGAYRESYFERILETYEPFHEKMPEEYVHELEEAIDKHQIYFTQASIEGAETQIYCAPLPGNSE